MCWFSLPDPAGENLLPPSGGPSPPHEASGKTGSAREKGLGVEGIDPALCTHIVVDGFRLREDFSLESLSNNQRGTWNWLVQNSTFFNHSLVQE